jgi:predicted double-glycine peptidase
MFGQVEPFQQSTEYTCSAAAEHAVMKHWGYDIDEVTLAYLLKVDPINGSNASRVVSVARSLGFAADSRKFKSLNELKHVTDQDVPVIARVLSWKHPGQHHFVVVTGVDDFGVSVMDPNVEGNRRRLSHDEMWVRWVPDRLGVVITPKGFQLEGIAVTRPWWLAVGLVMAVGAGAAFTYLDRRRKRRSLSGYYRIKDVDAPPPIREVAKKWVCQRDKAYEAPYEPKKGQPGVFWYDLDELLPYREYHHTRETTRAGGAYWDELVEDMRAGWKATNPAHIMIGKNGCVKIGEGNHRLAIARKLHLQRVPVRLHFWDRVAPDTPHIKCFDQATLCNHTA